MLDKLKSFKKRFRYDDSEMPFLEHLEEFRKTVIRVFIALTIGMLVCMPFADRLIGMLRAPAEPYIEKSTEALLNDTTVHLRIPVDEFKESAIIQDESGKRFHNVSAEMAAPDSGKPKQGVIRLQFSEPAAAIKMWLTVTFFGGILLSLPVLVFFIGSFVMPGVRDIERKVMVRIAVFSGILFLLGVFMGYKVTLPLALGLMLKIGGQLGGESIWFYNKYISFTLQLLLGFGIAFQLPVAILILGKMGLVSSKQLREKRRHVVIALLILAMVLTPPDVMTQLLMAGPLILLYEFCIWFLHFSGNRNISGSKNDREESKPEAESVGRPAVEKSEEDNQTKTSSEE